MVTLYKYRGQVDLIVADPPYNTGQYFRYNDRWDQDPNDPDLGTLVTLCSTAVISTALWANCESAGRRSRAPFPAFPMGWDRINLTGDYIWSDG
jgi:hypothetical protein